MALLVPIYLLKNKVLGGIAVLARTALKGSWPSSACSAVMELRNRPCAGSFFFTSFSALGRLSLPRVAGDPFIWQWLPAWRDALPGPLGLSGE